MEGKECTKCGKWKEIEKFPREKKRGKMIYRADCKECRAKYKLKLKEKNPAYKEKQIEATKKWLQSSEGKEWNHERGKLNRQKPEWKIYQKKGKAKYRQSEKGKATEKAYAKQYSDTDEYRAKNRRQLRKYRTTKRYKQWLHSDKGREIRYRARLKRRSNKHHVYFSPVKRKAILDRDKWKCQNCGCKVHDRSTDNWNTPDKAHIDHIIPLIKGGNSELSNLQTLCRTCNLSKQDKINMQLTLF